MSEPSDRLSACMLCIFMVVYIPEFFWSLWTGNYPLAALDVAYFWLAWSALPVASEALNDFMTIREECNDDESPDPW